MPDDLNDWGPYIREKKALKASAKAPPPRPPNGATNGDPSTPVRDRTYALAGLRKECDAVAGTMQGSRNDRLNTAAYSLGGFVPQLLAEEEVIDGLTAAALSAGLTEPEIRQTIMSGLRAAKANGTIRVVPPPTNGRRSDPGGSTANGNASTGADSSESEQEPPEDTKTLEDIEEDFWTARPQHQLIYTAALSRMASPWAVLSCCFARTLCLIPPTVTLPPLIGEQGSLNWFAAITAKSGGGKGAAMAVARRLVPSDDIQVRGIGSGEGMIEVYGRAPQKVEDPTPPVIAVMFSVDEIDSLGAMGSRSGQTTMAILRQGFSGETLGYSYRGRQSEIVTAHTYRMTLVASVQPQRAGVLLDDSGGGTPQRFMWFPGRDWRITSAVPVWPVDRVGRELSLSMMSSWEMANAAGIIGVPDTVATEIRDARAASMRGENDALDGHALFCREKFAYVLAYLDGRTAINEEDWRLSGIAATVSEWCRTKAVKWYREEKEKLSRERGQQRALEHDEEKITGDITLNRHVGRIVTVITKKLGELGPMTRGALRDRVAYRDRSRFDMALQVAAARGLIVFDDGKWALV